MSQNGKAGKNLIQVARDYIQSIQINIFSGNIDFSSILQPFVWIKSLFTKDRVIDELKRELKQKEKEIAGLQDDFNQKIDELVEAQRQLKMAQDIALSACKRASEAGLEDEATIMLRQLFPILNEQNKAREPYFRVALWFQRRANAWAEESVNIVIKEHTADIRLEEKQGFRYDIDKYMSWLCDSLLYAKPLRKSLLDLNNSRTISHPHPYREVFKHVKTKPICEAVSPEEFQALFHMIDYLIEEL